jgi:NADH:ubiquinone oxidoreductase subunit 6 (subunit J)
MCLITCNVKPTDYRLRLVARREIRQMMMFDGKGAKMREEFKWLVFASIAIGVVIVGLLILTFVPGLGWGWTRPSGYWMWSRTDFLNPWDFLANVTITLLLLAIPLSHIAWLVMAAIWLARSAGPPPAGGGVQLSPLPG